MKTFPSLSADCSLRLILVRHGEPSVAVDDLCYGRLDIKLSGKGRRQIRGTLPFLKLARPNALYTSTLRRALDSALIVGNALGLSPQPVQELAEIDFGNFEGRTYSEIQVLFPIEYKLWMEQPSTVTFPGGENFTSLKRRVLGFIGTLRQRHEGHTVVIVAHGGVNRVILAEALGIPDAMAFRLDQSHAATSIIDYFGQTPVVRLSNG
jgi:alpha-ribazole phosphatase